MKHPELLLPILQEIVIPVPPPLPLRLLAFGKWMKQAELLLLTLQGAVPVQCTERGALPPAEQLPNLVVTPLTLLPQLEVQPLR
jgi:hypothetical protein